MGFYAAWSGVGWRVSLLRLVQLAIGDGVRSPFCKAGTDFKSHSAQALGRVVVSELIERTGIDRGTISQVIFGTVAQPPGAANFARVIELNAGIPQEVPAYTVHRSLRMRTVTVFKASMISAPER